MKNLIAIGKEREKQLTKKTIQFDLKVNKSNQLSTAASYLARKTLFVDEFAKNCPTDWDTEQWNDLCREPYLKRLVIAGAFIVA